MLEDFAIENPDLELLDGETEDTVYVSLKSPPVVASKDEARYLASAEIYNCISITGHAPERSRGFLSHTGSMARHGISDNHFSHDFHPDIDYFYREIRPAEVDIRLVVGDRLPDRELLELVENAVTPEKLLGDIELGSFEVWHTGKGRPAFDGGEETGGSETGIAIDLEDGTHYRYENEESMEPFPV